MYTTPAFFRKIDALEEKMIRAMMPKVSASDPAPVARIANSVKSVKTLTYRMVIAEAN